MKENWFQLKYWKGGKTRYPAVSVCMGAPLGLMLPTMTKDKNEALNEAIDRLIDHLHKMRPTRKESEK